MIQKGILLAGGSNTRLAPTTLAVSKQLLPVYNKPMIYYPLSMLMLAGIRQVLVITRPEESGLFNSLLGDGSRFGIEIEYAVQDEPRGLADAFIVGAPFVAGDPVAMILGDNIFYGERMRHTLARLSANESGASVLAYYVREPQHYGVVEIDKQGRAINIEEKPAKPRSHYAVTGLYFYDGEVTEIARTLKPSARGELEVTDINRIYMERGALQVEIMGRGYAWLDTGTHESLLEASNFVASVERRQGLMISCLEEIAFRLGYIDEDNLRRQGEKLSNTAYGEYLLQLADHGIDYRSDK